VLIKRVYDPPARDDGYRVLVDRAELNRNPAVDELRESLERHPRVTLVFAARDQHVNHAAVLRDYLRPHGDRKE
jgi:uncharacterized protein YeaO (DUF488 family)